MTAYRGANIKGGTYFFTVNCAERHGNHLLEHNIDKLRKVFCKVKKAHPFDIADLNIMTVSWIYKSLIFHLQYLIWR